MMQRVVIPAAMHVIPAGFISELPSKTVIGSFEFGGDGKSLQLEVVGDVTFTVGESHEGSTGNFEVVRVPETCTTDGEFVDFLVGDHLRVLSG